MKKFRIVLSEDEKSIIENYFLKSKKINSAQNYKSFLLKKFSDLEILTDANTYDDIERVKDVEVDWIWDEKTNKTLLGHILEHKKFFISNNKINDIKKLKPNYLHQDSFGKNYLMYLASNFNTNINFISHEIIVGENLNKVYIGDSKKQIDNDGNSFYFYALNGFNFKYYSENIKTVKLKYQYSKESISFKIYNYLERFRELLNHINENSIEVIVGDEIKNNQFICDRCKGAVSFLKEFDKDLELVSMNKTQLAVMGMDVRELQDFSSISNIMNYYSLKNDLTKQKEVKRKNKL